MFEENLQRTLFSQQHEKTFIDKILAKEDVNRERELIRKKNLSREDLLELLYLLSGNEAKLVNYGAWDRYVILRFFVWIREFVKVTELLYDYQDDLNRMNKRKKLSLSYITIKLLKNNERFMEHNAKFLIDLYFNISRTTLSLSGTGLLEILRNKYEIKYEGMPTQSVQTGEAKPNIITLKR